MNFTDKQLEWARWLAVCALVAVFGFLGLQTPAIPPAPQNDLGILATNQKITANRAGDTMTFASGATLALASGSTFTVNGNAVGGSIRGGTASDVITGTTVTHGFTSAPSAFLIQPGSGYGATFSQTLYAVSCGASTCVVGISNGSVVTFTTAYWMAFK
jgi:hypothetical protein